MSAKDRGVTPTGTSLGSYISHRAVVAPRNIKGQYFMEPGRMSTEDLDPADVVCCVWVQFVESYSCPVRRKRCNSWWLELSRVHASFRSASLQDRAIIIDDVHGSCTGYHMYSKMDQLLMYLGA